MIFENTNKNDIKQIGIGKNNINIYHEDGKKDSISYDNINSFIVKIFLGHYYCAEYGTPITTIEKIEITIIYKKDKNILITSNARIDDIYYLIDIRHKINGFKLYTHDPIIQESITTKLKIYAKTGQILPFADKDFDSNFIIGESGFIIFAILCLYFTKEIPLGLFLLIFPTIFSLVPIYKEYVKTKIRKHIKKQIYEQNITAMFQSEKKIIEDNQDIEFYQKDFDYIKPKKYPYIMLTIEIIIIFLIIYMLLIT